MAEQRSNIIAITKALTECSFNKRKDNADNIEMSLAQLSDNGIIVPLSFHVRFFKDRVRGRQERESQRNRKRDPAPGQEKENKREQQTGTPVCVCNRTIRPFER